MCVGSILELLKTTWGFKKVSTSELVNINEIELFEARQSFAF